MASRDEAGANSREHQPAGYRLRTDVTITSSNNPQSGRKQYYVKSGESGEVFELGEEEYFFCVRLDGRVSFSEFRHAFETHFSSKLSYDKFIEFADELVDMRVLEPTPGDAFSAAATALIQDILDPKDTDPRATPFRRTLLDPAHLFERLAKFWRVARALSAAAPLLLIFAVAVFAHSTSDALGDLSETLRNLSVFVVAPVGLLTVNLVAKLVQGATAYREGASVRGLGVIFFFGFFPRFYIEDQAIRALNDEPQRRVYASALKTRVVIGSLAVILWGVFRSGGGVLPDFFLLVGHIAFGALIWGGLPLVLNDGYRWMSLLLHQPNLRERSFGYFAMRLRGRPAPPDMSAADRTCALLYATASLLYLAALLVLMFAYVSVKLETSFGGAGVAMAVAILGASFAWYTTSRHAAERVRKSIRKNLSVGSARAAGPHTTSAEYRSETPGAVIHLQPQRQRPFKLKPTERTAPNDLKKRWAWFGGALAAFAFLLLPYQYKPGGEFQVLPNHRYQVNARIDGEIAQVFVKEGEWVKKGQPLIKLSNWMQERQLAESQAELDRSKAVLARLLAGAKPEEIALAESQVASAASQIEFKRGEMRRAQALIKDGYATARSLEMKRSEYDTAAMNLKVAEANLAVVKSGSTTAELDVARAEVRRLENEVAFRKEDMSRTLIVAPTTGAVVTANVDLNTGSSLKTGDVVVEIEDTRTARIEVNLAQSDVRYIKVGDRVQVKPWGFSNETLIGKVIGIAPSADSTKDGRHVRVLTDLPNPDQRLRSQMSGYAKVEGQTLQVWSAYLLFFIRFVEIEVWSWIP